MQHRDYIVLLFERNATSINIRVVYGILQMVIKYTTSYIYIIDQSAMHKKVTVFGPLLPKIYKANLISVLCSPCAGVLRDLDAW